jgi:hypothetical protein
VGVQIYLDRMGPTDNPAGWQWAIDQGGGSWNPDLPVITGIRGHREIPI